MNLPPLVIANGATLGTPIDVLHINQLTIFGPAALTGVISIEVSPDKGTTWFPRAGVPAIDIAVDVNPVNAHQMRLVSGSAEGAERTFLVHGSSLVTV